MKLPSILAPMMKNRGVASVLAFIPVIFILLNISKFFVWKCPFFEYLGLQCCGCGMTRGVISLFKGEFTEAALYNPFAFLLVPVYVIWILLLFIPEKKREIIIEKIDIFEHKTGFTIVIILFFISFGLVRLIFQIYDSTG